MFKTLLLLSVFTSLIAPASATPVLIQAWQTPNLLEQPESVVYYAHDNALYVSNIKGDPNIADGNGYISQLSISGEIIEQHWLKGLNAPKGMTIVGNSLFVADINELIEINITEKKVIGRYLAADAKFLNDVVADNKGHVYVSDMLTNTIHILKNGKFSVWLHDTKLEAPNGLLVEGEQLIVGSWGNMTEGFATDIPGHLKTINLKTKQVESLGNKSPVGNLDGVEADGHGHYYVTDWMNGKLLHITAQGESQTLLSLKQGIADHVVLQKQKLIIIPMMLSGHVIAYQIGK